MSLQRVLLAVHHYPPRRMGGAELLTRRLAQWLSQHGIAVQVICIENVAAGAKTQLVAREELDGDVSVQRLDITFGANQELSLWFDEPVLASYFETICDTWQPDLVHLVSGYLMGTAPLDAARERGIPTVVTLTDFWFLCPTIQLLRGDGSLCQGPEALECARCLYDQQRIFRVIDQRAPQLMRAFWETAHTQTWLGTRLGLPSRIGTLQARKDTLVRVLNQTDGILSLTRFVAELHIANGVDAQKITVKPDCLDLEDFEPIEPRPIRTDEIHFGYIGQVTAIKGVDILLRAFLKARERSKKPVQLHIHGNLNAEASYARELEKLAANCPAIVFHGAYEHRRALALLNELDALVVPSLWYENSPRVILEAFAARRPVIGTRVGGIAEVVQDNETGLLFERSDVDDLARVMTRVTEDATLLPGLARNIPRARTLEEDMRDVLAAYNRAQSQHVAEWVR
jgi:glycosyltransferase involved in cell wall biosynthesis